MSNNKLTLLKKRDNISQIREILNKKNVQDDWEEVIKNILYNNEEWTDNIEKILDKMRINCINFSEYHMIKYRVNKGRLAYFRIPIIILSAANVFFALGLQNYIKQEQISIINGILSLICGVLTSIELFLNIQKNMENDLMSHKDFYRLNVDIYKTISLDRETRKVDGKTFLDQKFSEYEKLIESCNIIDNVYVFDTLSCELPIKNLERINIDSKKIEDIISKNTFMTYDFFNHSTYDNCIYTCNTICCCFFCNNLNYLKNKKYLNIKKKNTIEYFYEEHKNKENIIPEKQSIKKSINERSNNYLEESKNDIELSNTKRIVDVNLEDLM